MKASRKELTRRRHFRIRRSLTGTPERPRMAVFRSNQNIYVQVIDDTTQSTLASASTVDPDLKGRFIKWESPKTRSIMIQYS